MAIFSKILTETDIKKRLHVPTKKKTCFLNFRGQRKEEFKAIDEDGQVWRFVCFRREGDYPKPVLSSGWLPFVRRWNLAVGDKVILSKAGGHYRIQVIKRAAQQQRTKVVSPPVQNHYPERTMGVAGNVEEEPTLISHSTDQVITKDQTEPERTIGVSGNFEEEPTLISHSTDQVITNDQTEPERTMRVSGNVEEEPTLISHSTDQVITNDQTGGLRNLEFISLTPGSQVGQPELIDFFQLQSRTQPEWKRSNRAV